MFRKATATIGNIIRPARVAAFSVAFADGSPGIALTLRIARDTPVTPAEKRLMEGILADAVGTPLTLDVVTLPVVPPLVFPEGKTELTDGMRVHIRQAAEYGAGFSAPLFNIESSPERSLPRRKGRALAMTRAGRVAAELSEQHGISKDRILINVGKKGENILPSVKISIVPEEMASPLPSPGPADRRDG